jgi:4-amino-4-deoxy-L-arabinose transferase-like glycosyltransferase
MPAMSSAQPELIAAAPRVSTARAVALLVALWLVVYASALWTPPLLDDADSVHAEAAREMMLRHDWSTLYVDGLRYLEKAPLLYWGMAASYEVFGVRDWAARLPLALGVLALLLTTYFVGRRYFDSGAGLYAAAAVGLSFGPYIYTRFLIPDMLLALWLLVGLHAFLLTLESVGYGPNDGPPAAGAACWLLAASCALNVLTKGLIGIVFPVAIIGGYLLLTGNLRQLLRMRLVSSAVVFLVIAAPWHIWAGLRNPAAGEARGFFWFYFVNEHFLRYLNQRFPRDYDTVLLPLFWALPFLFLLPWSAFAVPAVRALPPRRQWRGLDQPGRALLLMAVAVVVVVGFFSFSSRQEYYVLPILPPLTLITGAWMSREQSAPPESELRRTGRRVALAAFVVAVPLALACFGLLAFSQSVPRNTELATLLTRNPSEYALSFGHIFDLTPRAMGLFRAELLLAGAGLLLGTLAAWRLRCRARVAASNAALGAMMVLLLLVVHSALVTFSPILSSRTLSDALVPLCRAGDVVVVNGAYEDASTLNFYGHLPLHVLNSRENGNLYFGSLFPDAPALFEDDASMARLWHGPTRVFVFSQQSELRPEWLATGKVVAESGGKVIVVNHP